VTTAPTREQAGLELAHDGTRFQPGCTALYAVEGRGQS